MSDRICFADYPKSYLIVQSGRVVERITYNGTGEDERHSALTGAIELRKKNIESSVYVLKVGFDTLVEEWKIRFYRGDNGKYRLRNELPHLSDIVDGEIVKEILRSREIRTMLKNPLPSFERSSIRSPLPPLSKFDMEGYLAEQARKRAREEEERRHHERELELQDNFFRNMYHLQNNQMPRRPMPSPFEAIFGKKY